jgi:hypothetical protein
VPLQCPVFQELIDFEDGRLEPEAAGQVKRHLASGCVKCAADRSWYQRLRSLARSDSRFSPPIRARNRAIRLFQDEREKPSSGGSNLYEIALLAYDSLRDRPPGGARSSEASERQLVYSAGGYSIDLQIGWREGAGADVIGQILQEGGRGFASVAGLLVDLLKLEEAVWSTVTNDVGEFRMIGVDFGEYELTIDTQEKQVRIPTLPILL